MSLYFKVLDANQRSCNGGSGEWTPGQWRSTRGDLVPCGNGLHFATLGQLPEWLGPAIWDFQLSAGTETIVLKDKLVCRTGRITRQYAQWNERTARLFACDCAEHVLPIFEERYPLDNRPRHAIEVARGLAQRDTSTVDWAAAWLGRSTIDSSAATAAAWNAAWAAAWAAWCAAKAAARAAAAAAARADDKHTGWADERRWQVARLAEVLEIEVPA